MICSFVNIYEFFFFFFFFFLTTGVSTVSKPHQRRVEEVKKKKDSTQTPESGESYRDTGTLPGVSVQPRGHVVFCPNMV